jgi:hypothetical protein
MDIQTDVHMDMNKTECPRLLQEWFLLKNKITENQW